MAKRKKNKVTTPVNTGKQPKLIKPDKVNKKVTDSIHKYFYGK